MKKLVASMLVVSLISIPFAWARTAHVGKTNVPKNLNVTGNTVVVGSLTAGSISTAGTVTVPAGSIARSKITAETGVYPVDLQSKVRNDDGTTLAATASAGKFGITNGTHSAPGLKLTGETANNNTKTDYASMVFTVPPEYVAAGNLTVSVTVDLEGSGTAGTNTIDVQAFEVNTSGVAGSDICATAAQNMSATPVERTFTITGTNLVPGDKVLIYFTMALAESASTNLNGAITDARVSASIKG